jgi:xanthine dehydrogenase YagS FAD-binding subunit
VAVSPSDCATALVALDAQMVVRGRGGERVIPAGQFFMGPGRDIRRMTVLDPDDLLISVRLPSAWAGADFYFEKVTDRNSWDFALVSVAAAFRTEGGRVQDARVVCGAVQCVPRRLTGVERVVRGQVRSEQLAEMASAGATDGAEPLAYNHFKIPLMQNLVKRAVRG